MNLNLLLYRTSDLLASTYSEEDEQREHEASDCRVITDQNTVELGQGQPLDVSAYHQQSVHLSAKRKYSRRQQNRENVDNL